MPVTLLLILVLWGISLLLMLQGWRKGRQADRVSVPGMVPPGDEFNLLLWKDILDLGIERLDERIALHTSAMRWYIASSVLSGIAFVVSLIELVHTL